jgi:prepilin-type N-terminal cleavage/methylation domain-containing protein
MKNDLSAGFTLIELIVAVLMSSIVLLAISSILTPLVMSEVYSAKAQTVQLTLAMINQTIERELRQATAVTTPTATGTSSVSNVLEGCGNAVLAGTSYAQIDTTVPMTWFAVCANAGIVYYYSGSGACPGSYTCGASPTPTAQFTWPDPWSSLVFSRPSAQTTLITAVMQGSSGSGAVVTSTTAVAYAAPAGGNQ